LITLSFVGLFPNQQNGNNSNSNSIPPPVNKVGGATMRDYAPHVPGSVYYYPQPEIPMEDLADHFTPLWSKHTAMDLSVFINEDEYFSQYHATPAWQAKNIVYGDNVDDRREHRIAIPVTEVTNHSVETLLMTPACVLCFIRL
jgi:hypothetical protein